MSEQVTLEPAITSAPAAIGAEPAVTHVEGTPTPTPPPGHIEWQFTPTQEQASFVSTIGEERLSAFEDVARKAGMSEAQFKITMDSLFEVMPHLASGVPTFDAETSLAELRKEWRSDDELRSNVEAARAALATFGGDDAKAIIDAYGNDFRIIRLLARIGTPGSAAPVTSAPTAAPRGASSNDFLARNWDAYNNPRHVDHGRVSQEFRRLSAIEAGAAGQERVI